MTKEVAVKASSEVAVPSEAVRAEVARMVAVYPEATDDGEGAARVAMLLLAAGEPEDLNAPWDTEKWRETLVGPTLRIETIEPRPSDYKDGYGVYLLVTGVNLATGEPFTAGIGSGTVMIQLLAAGDRGWLPINATIVGTQSKRDPMVKWYRLQVHGRAD